MAASPSSTAWDGVNSGEGFRYPSDWTQILWWPPTSTETMFWILPFATAISQARRRWKWVAAALRLRRVPGTYAQRFPSVQVVTTTVAVGGGGGGRGFPRGGARVACLRWGVGS